MNKSTHKVEVVSITLEPHPNADSLSIVRIFGYTIVVKTEQWEGINIGAYIVPDSVVDITRPEFSFLTNPRIKVKKLRGVVSMGLLMPAPLGAQVGDDVAEYYGVTRYEPPLENLSTGGEIGPTPDGIYYKYDIDTYYRYPTIFQKEDEVWITEKLHGSSARYVFQDNDMYIGSRNEWKKGDGNIWAGALKQNTWIEEWCRAHEGYALYGEVFGYVQDLKYGHGKGQYSFRVFDVLHRGRWLDFDELFRIGLDFNKLVPTLYVGHYHPTLIQYADGDSCIPKANHIREGIVIKPVVNRQDDAIGRVILKVVSNKYLERA